MSEQTDSASLATPVTPGMSGIPGISGTRASLATPTTPIAPTTPVTPALSRALAPRHITLIGLGGVIGAGLFVGSSVSIAATGPAVVISYLLAGTLLLCIMRMLGEMTVALPDRRALIDFTRAGLGEDAGFVIGWTYWYFWVVAVAVEAIAGATLLQRWIALPAWQIGLGLMAAMTGINLLSTRWYGEFEFWFASIKVAAIIAFMAVAISYAFGLTAPHQVTFGNLVSHGGFTPRGPLAVLAGVVSVFAPLAGAEIATIAAVESREPARAVARIVTSLIARILLFYVGSVLLIVAVVPWDRVVPGVSPFTLALERMGFSWAGMAMSVVILTAVLSCLNSAFYVTSRVLFILASHGDAPQGLVRLNGRRVPARSVLIGCAAGVLGVIAASLWPDTVFAFLVNACGALILFVYLATCLSQIRLRRARSRAGESDPPLRMWLFPWVSYATVAAIVAVLITMAFTPELQSQLGASLAALLIAMVACAVRRAYGGNVQ